MATGERPVPTVSEEGGREMGAKEATRWRPRAPEGDGEASEGEGDGEASEGESDGEGGEEESDGDGGE